MTDKKTIEQCLAENQLDLAISMLDGNIEEEPTNSLWWYLRGRVYWRMDRRGNAISDYEEAVHLDPASPAVHALDMARSIMDYYNTDLLNP